MLCTPAPLNGALASNVRRRMALKDLLERGYFPKELPRPFVTVDFAALMSTGSPAPGDWGKPPTKKGKPRSGKVDPYSLARGGLLRRGLAICNPLHYFQLAREIDTNWAAILPKVSGTAIAATSPEWKSSGRAIDGRNAQSERPRMARETRLGRRYILRTDISRFYHSIYTHSLAWALHTKSVAKANHKMTLLGNRLDVLIRNGQDAQTIGVPIGPDTSLLAAELIMQRCDEQLALKISSLKGHRFIDDYELAFLSRTEAEDAFHLLEACLAEYELALNPKKTDVLELPLPFEATWATELKRMPIRAMGSAQAADLHAIFNRAFELHLQFPEEAVLQFLLGRLRHAAVTPANWPLFQILVLNCIVPEPATLPYALEQLIIRINAGAVPMRDEISEILNLLVRTHAPRGHTSEVANSLWGCLALEIPLESDAVAAVSRFDSSAVALLALDLQSYGFTAVPLDTTIWEAHMTGDGLYDSHWLLAYEANIKGWLPSKSGVDHVMADPIFAHLKSHGVSFYDRRLAKAPPMTKKVLPTLPTVSTVGGGGGSP